MPVGMVGSTMRTMVYQQAQPALRASKSRDWPLKIGGSQHVSIYRWDHALWGAPEDEELQMVAVVQEYVECWEVDMCRLRVH